jgi:replicative DNA helicase
MIEASHDIGLMGYAESEDVDELLDDAERKIFAIAQKSLTQKFLPIKDTLEEAFERIDKLSKHGGEMRGLATGFTDLDNMLTGLQKSDLVILAARPSMGKSAFAVDMARNIAVHHKIPVGIFSLEMSKDQVVDRLIAAQSGVDLWKLRTGKLSTDDFAKIQNAMGVLSETPIYIDDTSSSNIIQIRALARRLQADKGLGMIVVDYLQLMEPRNSTASMVQQVTEVSRSLKGLARELNIPVLALSQLSRSVEMRSPAKPRLSDLRESGALEQDADVVLFIYREKERGEAVASNIAEIIIAKHRNGPVGAVKVYFDSQRVTFKNLDKSMQDALTAQESENIEEASF